MINTVLEKTNELDDLRKIIKPLHATAARVNLFFKTFSGEIDIEYVKDNPVMSVKELDSIKEGLEIIQNEIRKHLPEYINDSEIFEGILLEDDGEIEEDFLSEKEEVKNPN